MDQVVDQFFSYGTLGLGIAVVILTFFARRIVETAVPSAKKAKDENEDGLTYTTRFSVWWNGVILYAIPVVGGAGLGAAAVAAQWSLTSAVTTVGGGAIYGSIVGWFSSFLYKVVRKTLKAKTGIDPIPGGPDSDDITVTVDKE